MTETSAPLKRRLRGRILALAKIIYRMSPGRAIFAASLLVMGSLVEGLSIALLLPLFHFIGLNGHSTLLVLPMGALAPVLGETVTIDLWVLLTLYCGLIALVALFTKFKSYYVASLFSEVINQIRVDLFRSIASARWSTVARMRKADLDHALTGDIDRVQMAISSLYAICQVLVACLVYVFLSAFLSLKMTIFALVAGALIFVLQRPIRKRAASFGEKLTKERRAQYRTISDFLGALKVAKSFNAEERYAVGLADTLDRVRRDTLDFVAYSANGTLIYQILSAAIACIFIYVSYVVYHVDFARILILLFVFMRIAPRATELQSQFQIVMTNLPAYEGMQSIRELCDQSHEMPSGLNQAAPELRDAISFDNVTFAYDTTTVIKNVSWSAQAGQMTALVGPSGGGKSTMADLAMGLLLPDTGSISIDGHNLTPEDLRPWRSRTAYVPQETYLIAATLAENLRLAAPEASLGEIRTALDQARALSFVEALPQGLETRVGDGGITLSGGERQRISLARALLKRPSLLILDEVTSALDRQNTEAIIDTLSGLRGQMTILLITHDPLVHARADRVIQVANGTVTEPAASA
jgi:ATP-binding cassette subfamily C protein